jgi:hypothetical protein
LHPTHNFAVVQYDPKLLGDTDVMSAPFSDKTLLQGHKVTLVAHNHNQRPVCLNTVVTDVTCVTIPHNGVSLFFVLVKQTLPISFDIRNTYFLL